MQRNVTFAPGEFYHLYNRGTEKRTIYKNKSDYNRFLVLMYLCNSTKQVSIANEYRRGSSLNDMYKIDRIDTLVDIGAHVLMPNHFHILVHEKNEGGISMFMKKLGTAYSMYFNTKYERSGNLFQGRFKATHANEDNYLKYLFSYIHLNPVKLINSNWKENGINYRKKAERYLETYTYSSYIDYIGHKREEGRILNTKSFPDFFKKPNTFKEYVRDWISFSNDS